MKYEKNDIYGSAKFEAPESKKYEKVIDLGATPIQKHHLQIFKNLQLEEPQNINLKNDDFFEEVLSVYVLILQKNWKYKIENLVEDENGNDITCIQSMPNFLSGVASIINSSNLQYKNELANLFLIYFQQPVYQNMQTFVSSHESFNFYNFDNVIKIKLEFFEFLSSAKIEA